MPCLIARRSSSTRTSAPWTTSSPPRTRQRLTELVDVVWGRDDPMPLAEFEAALPDAFAVVSAGWRYGDVLADAPGLRAILTVSGGWPPELDYAHCFERGIRVLSAAPAFAEAVAEMALALALASSRDIVAEDRAVRATDERWLSSAESLATFLLAGKRVGFVGFGNIGRRLRALLEPFGCELCAYDPWLTDAYLRDERVRADRPGAAARDVAGRLRARDAVEREPGAALARAARARAARCRARPRQPGSRGRLRRADRARSRRPFPRRDRRLSRRAARPPTIRSGRRPGRCCRRTGPGWCRRRLWEIGTRVVDDLEALVNGLPPRRLQVGEPELATRYVRTTQMVAR